MKFGPVPTQQARGAVLAHSIVTPTGRLRKGHLLEEADIAALLAGDIPSVIVAQLDTGDIDENKAASQLASTLAGDNVTVTKAFTGRVNLIAPTAGVVKLNVAAIEAVNAIHPMITVATVPPFYQMAARGLIATIKIISYAVPVNELQQACACAGERAIALQTPVLRSATLIISQVSGGAGEKGRAAIEARVQALGVTLEEVVLVPHQTDAISTAIATADTDLVLILTGSATSDIDDVAPSALRAVGGTVERFGMPVDPGNLLFIGDLKGRPVIGLPGCARSPALNGADWVLSRVICGVPVRDRDIAAMGVGGLLKEIPTRPQPRRGT